MNKLFSGIADFFTASDSDYSTRNYQRILLIILACWAVMWTVLPCIALDNDFVDVLENIVWGKHWDWGYDKNPYLGAWFGYSVWVVSARHFFSSFLASQILVCIGIFSVWLVARRIFPARTAFLSAILLLTINFYGIKAVELCDDIMEIGLWPLTMLYVYLGVRGEERKKPCYWLLAGLFSGASFVVKYFAPALFLSVALPLLFTAEGRKSFRSPWFYMALIPFAVLVVPNIVWLFQHQGTPLAYAATRANLNSSVAWTDHFLNPLSAINRAAGVIGVAFGFFAVFFLIREKRENRVRYSAFDRFFATSCCWGPFASALVFSLVTGGSINYSWVVPCFPFFGIWLFMLWQPRISMPKARLFTAAVLLMGCIFGIIFLIRSLEHQGYRKRGCDYENMPGKQIVATAGDTWRKHAPGKIPFVVGNRECSCITAVYSPDEPEAFFDADTAQSAWINPDEVRRKGCLIIWEGREDEIPRKLRIFRDQFPQERRSPVSLTYLERAVPAWYRSLRGPAPKHPYCFQVILPERTKSGDLR